MDKIKIKINIKEAIMHAKYLENAFPKARNRVGSLLWNLKAISEEVEKVDVVEKPAIEVKQS